MSVVKNTSIFQNFSKLFSGLVVVQIINFIYSLFLPKFFSPTDFAEFGIYTSVAFILVEIVNAKLDVAVMLGNTLEESKKIMYAAITIALIAFIIAILFQFLFLFFVPKIYLSIPIVLLLYGIFQPILVYFNKQEKYQLINWFRIIQVISTCIVTLLLAYIHITHALIFGFILGLCFATLFVCIVEMPKINFSYAFTFWKKFEQFPKYGILSSLLNNISKNSVPLLLSAFFPKTIVGNYTYATRLLNAPTGMYTTALGQVYFKTATDANHKTLKNLTHKIVFTSFAIGIIPTIVILFFGKEVFASLFSNEWLEAGKMAQYLILWYFLGMITAPVSTLLDVKQKLKSEFIYNFILLILRTLAIVIGGLLHNFLLAILLFSAVGCVMNLILLFYINNYLLQND